MTGNLDLKKTKYKVELLADQKTINLFVTELIAFVNNAPNPFRARISRKHSNVVLISERVPIMAVAVSERSVEFMPHSRQPMSLKQYPILVHGAALGVLTYIAIFNETCEDLLKERGSAEKLATKNKEPAPNDYTYTLSQEDAIENSLKLKNIKFDYTKYIKQNKKYYPKKTPKK